MSISSRPNSPPSPACGLRPRRRSSARRCPCVAASRGLVDDAAHALARDRVERLPDALVQRRVRYLHVAEAQHHEDVVLGAFRSRARRTRGGRRTECRRARSRFRSAGRRRRPRPASTARLSRRRRRTQATHARPRRSVLPSEIAVRLRAVEHREPIAGHAGVLDPPDRMQLGPRCRRSRRGAAGYWHR